jgi:uncharacterized membrane protein YoaT (DUF817 family)
MTDIFKCERCGNADSIHATHQVGPGYECHRCKLGSWHGQFPEEKYDYYTHGPALNDNGSGAGDDFPSFS